MVAPVPTTVAAVRRLAIARQQLATPRARRARADAIVDLVGELGYVQWDPVTTVAPSHLISLWARLGPFRPTVLEQLLWEDKRLFEHWTPVASLVRTDDYPLFASLMTRYPRSLTHSWGSQRLRTSRFLARHRPLRQRVLAELRQGPRTTAEFTDHRRTQRAGEDWNPGSDLAEMVYHLLMSGDVMVVGHRGAQNLWGLSEEFLPADTDRRPLTPAAFERTAARRALHALGTATPRELSYYFVRGRYEHLEATLGRMERADEVRRVQVDGFPRNDRRYVLTDDLRALEAIADVPPPSVLTLVPPFDNLVGSTARLEQLFDFHYVREQFLPPAKRRFGTYVLPIVTAERCIGRIDPQLDRASRTLVVNAVHAEPNAPEDADTAVGLDKTIRSLAAFAGATSVRYTDRVPRFWRRELH